MSLPNLERKGKIKVLVVVITTLVSLLLFTKTLYAESLVPNITEINLSYTEISNKTLSITNDNDYDIYITPKVYKYYPHSEYIEEINESESFIIADTDSIKIDANSKEKISFQIYGNQALQPGTHYNLIVFTNDLENKKDNTSIGTTAQLSHLVVLNLVENPEISNVTNNYNTDIEIINKGIPFIKPAQIKITFYNNSTYTLMPRGEIQILKHSENKQPQYIKINQDREKVYPSESVEMIYDIDHWYIEDILFSKKAYIKLGNGIDNTLINDEVLLPNFRNEIIYIIITTVVIMIVIKSIKKDTKQISKSSQ
jgi:hypothetical protein